MAVGERIWDINPVDRREYAMTGRQSGQAEIILMDLRELIPEDHLLTAIDECTSFEFVYDLMAPLCAGRDLRPVLCL